MRVWPALILAPLLAIACITFGYALVTPACAGGQWMLHALLVGSFLISLASTAWAFLDVPNHKEPFLPLVAAGTGAFFSLVIAAQWATQLFIPPCTP